MLVKFWYWLTSVQECKNCEYLRDLLSDERIAKEQILKSLLELNRPQAIVKEKSDKEEIKPILPQTIPWRVRKELLESEDRKRAEVAREYEKSTSELEKELGIENVQ